MNPSGGCNAAPASGGTMLRMLGPIQKREVKATQNLSIIVLFFIVCWIPLYTINCVQAFCQDCVIPLELTNFCIILSHVNSAVNPLLYAYHLRDFRAALKGLLCCLFGIKGDNAVNDTQGK
jgi:adenosine receptor A2a